MLNYIVNSKKKSIRENNINKMDSIEVLFNIGKNNPEFMFYHNALEKDPDADLDELEREYHRLYDNKNNLELLEDYFEPLKTYNILLGNGNNIIKEALKKQSVKILVKTYRDLKLLEKGTRFSKDSFDYFSDIDIYELRIRFANIQVRLLYFKETYEGEKRAIITNCFLKKTGKTPQSEKEKAVNRREIYKKDHRVERSIPNEYRED